MHLPASFARFALIAVIALFALYAYARPYSPFKEGTVEYVTTNGVYSTTVYLSLSQELSQFSARLAAN